MHIGLFSIVALQLFTILQIHLMNEQLHQLRRDMADIQTELDAINAATTAAGQRVADLVASIKANGQTLTDAQQAEADAIVAHLTDLGAAPAVATT